MAHVSLITLGVTDLDRETAFYEAIGWERSSASVDGEVAFLRGGTVALALWSRDELAADTALALARPPGPIALAINLPDEPAVDALLASGSTAGGRVVKPAVRTDWGGYSGYLADPDGHLWEVAHNPYWPVDADGRIDLPR